jgi:hypothetical protein
MPEEVRNMSESDPESDEYWLDVGANPPDTPEGEKAAEGK